MLPLLGLFLGSNRVQLKRQLGTPSEAIACGGRCHEVQVQYAVLCCLSSVPPCSHIVLPFILLAMCQEARAVKMAWIVTPMSPVNASHIGNITVSTITSHSASIPIAIVAAAGPRFENVASSLL